MPVKFTESNSGDTLMSTNPVLTTEEMRRIVAVSGFCFRMHGFALQEEEGFLPDKGRSCFTSGANAAIFRRHADNCGNHH